MIRCTGKLYRYYSNYCTLVVIPTTCPYSRQRYVLGDSAMHKMARSTVFISGMGGLGVEIGN